MDTTRANLPDLRCFSSLRTAEAWLLCTLRLSMGRYDAQFCYEQGFAAARMPEGSSEVFARATNLIKASAGRRIDIRPAGESELSADEESFLATIHALQHGDEFTARRFMQRWLRPAGARLVVSHLNAFAQKMAVAGLRIPARTRVAIPCPALLLAARRLTELEAESNAGDQPQWLN